MSVALLLIHDGREDYLDRTMRSAVEHLVFDFDQRIAVDDTAHELGFAGAIQAGWDQVETDYVFHLEGDFVFNERVDLPEMINLLQQRPDLAQVALRRQPWNEEEKAAGGIVELHPDDFTEEHHGSTTFTTHRRFFTTNPSVYPARLCRLGWPQERFSEGVFTHRLLQDPLLRFAFWGRKFAPPQVTHIGDVRAGVGY